MNVPLCALADAWRLRATHAILQQRRQALGFYLSASRTALAGGVTHIGLGVPGLPSRIVTGTGRHAQAANRYTRTDPSMNATTGLAILANLLAYSTVVSQPLFYLVALTSAQRALSGSAFVELRQRINAVMDRRIPVIYSTTLVTTLVLVVLSWRGGHWWVLGTTLVALLCLIADAAWMVRKSVPINAVMSRWSTTDYPGDWELYRTRWFAIFGYRQAVLLIGFVSLLVGAVFQG